MASNDNDNVTLRNKCVQRSVSQQSIESIDSLSTPQSAKSMLDLSTHFKNEEFKVLTDTINKLKAQLMSAHAEIDVLTLENNSLQQKLQEERRKVTQYKNMYVTSLSVKKNNTASNIKHKKNSLNRNNLSSRKLDLDIDFLTPQRPSLQQSDLDTNMEFIHSGEAQIDKPFILSSKEIQNKTLKSQVKKQVNENIGSHSKTSTLKYGQIILLSDNQGAGIAQKLIRYQHKLILNKYKIFSITKPFATTENVLSSCNVLSQKLTKRDSVIIMSGSNDSNP
ncbi:unnamed protein product [Arctia plantaginis]|uniref:Uncharacterized protein n=1 Tax=Arctia plantaginis TaxID=874455 RepID=A0A8S0ZWF9_ARCPL|nr:unnamed protein product [Arctia plantaginis]